MSSSGPYQSRLFNLLNRYKIRWSDRIREQLQQMGITLIDRPNGETSIVH